MAEPRYYLNDLEPYHLDAETTPKILFWLQSSILTATQLIESKSPAAASDSHENLYTGHSGIAWTYIRLRHQLPRLEVNYNDIIQKHKPHLHRHAPHSGKLSPIGTATGAALVEVCNQVISGTEDEEAWDKAMVTLETAVKEASESESDGGDEALYGRTGLLWGLLNLQELVGTHQEGIKLKPLEIVKAVPKIVRKIVEAGRRGGVLYENKTGEYDGKSLVWEWHGRMYLGAMHGSAGILTVLFQVPSNIIEPYLPELLSTTETLCRLTIDNDGHLPASLPPKHRSDPYVQICHGSPGLVLLLTTLKQRFPSHWEKNPIYRSALSAAGEKVWEQGLVTKGLGICHGVSGNAWVLLLLSLVSDGEERKMWVGRALALLVEAAKMPPLGEAKCRMPDRPLSLFEGVAGAVAAWAEAYQVVLGDSDKKVLGFVGLGGTGVRGYL